MICVLEKKNERRGIRTIDMAAWQRVNLKWGDQKSLPEKVTF